MATANLVDQTGATTGSVDLDPEIFETTPNGPLMHQALVRQQANARQGTHDTKTRTEVSGGGRKPYKQKGTGRARQGSIRAPQYAGGGAVFGPHPRSYAQDMPRKQRRLALRSALAVKAQEAQLVVLEGFERDTPQTKAVVELLRGVDAGRRVLLVLGSHNEVLERSARNIAEVQVLLASNLNVRDLLIADTVLMTRDALDHVTEVLA
jgi:large subunit ribosomal protein L4